MSSTYTKTARVLHWLIAVLVLIQFGLGFGTDIAGEALSWTLLDAHVQFGLTIFALMVLRMLWRLSHPAPPLPQTIPKAQAFAARTAHLALYVLLVLMPVSGYLLWMWIGRNVAFLGLADIPFPYLEGKDEYWRSIAGYTHEFAGYALLALLFAHIGAALSHEWRGDRVIRGRML